MIAHLTWQEKLRANTARLWSDALASLATSSPMVSRLLTALATTLVAVGLWTAGDHWEHLRILGSMRDTMPRWGWAMLFSIGAIGLWWRLVDNRPRIRTGILVNAHVAALWVLFTVELALSGGLIAAAAPLTMTLKCVWIVIRTGVTQLDRSRA